MGEIKKGEEYTWWEKADQKTEDKEVIPTEGKRVIVDVGSGQYPFPYREETRGLGKNEVYVGVELNPEEVKKSSKFIEENKIGEGRAYIVRGAGQQLPLADKSADEVVMELTSRKQ